LRETAEFGDSVAYYCSDAHKGESNEGEQNGKEDFEEGKEDRSNQASGEDQVSVERNVRRLTLFQERGVRALQSFSLEKG
jgi:hypothetical protein